MEQGVLGSAPILDGNKRKRADAKAAYISSMMQGNPKLLLSKLPLFEGLTQHQLPFYVSLLGTHQDPDTQYQARICLHLPDNSETWGVGVARTKKESERVAAVDACRILHEKGLLLGINKNGGSSSGWGDNPKNTLVTSVAFCDVCCGGNARGLPITVRSSGPDHAKVFVAELAVPLRACHEVYVAVGQGRNKSEAERACCTTACEKLHQEGLLSKPHSQNPSSSTPVLKPGPTKAVQIQQQNEQPEIVGLRDEELAMMDDALQRLHYLKADGMAGLSHVIIDEVHKRDVDTDFLLVVVRELLSHHPSLRVVVMSATLDASMFNRYFGGCPLVNIPGMTHPVQIFFLDDLPQLMGHHSIPASRVGMARFGTSDDEDVGCELFATVVAWVAQFYAQGDGAILCLLPGWDTIAMVRERLLKIPWSKALMLVPLHSQLPVGEQRVAFAQPPVGVRKVVLATNIAETSVTIDDVIYVIYCGKVKENQFDALRNMTTMRVQEKGNGSVRRLIVHYILSCRLC